MSHPCAGTSVTTATGHGIRGTGSTTRRVTVAHVHSMGWTPRRAHKFVGSNRSPDVDAKSCTAPGNHHCTAVRH
jgi:hypothetical protein